MPSNTGEDGRYMLHDFARVFAKSRMNDAVCEQVRLRHAEHYKSCYLWPMRLLGGKEGALAGLQLFDQEKANIMAGQSWAEKNLEGNFSGAVDLSKSYPDAGAYVLDLRLSPRQKIPWLE